MHARCIKLTGNDDGKVSGLSMSSEKLHRFDSVRGLPLSISFSSSIQIESATKTCSW